MHFTPKSQGADSEYSEEQGRKMEGLGKRKKMAYLKLLPVSCILMRIQLTDVCHGSHNKSSKRYPLRRALDQAELKPQMREEQFKR